jgi:hypothetical protein
MKRRYKDSNSAGPDQYMGTYQRISVSDLKNGILKIVKAIWSHLECIISHPSHFYEDIFHHPESTYCDLERSMFRFYLTYPIRPFLNRSTERTDV